MNFTYVVPPILEQASGLVQFGLESFL